MRHQNKWRMKHILPMMALAGLGLMSCEEEVIPLEDGDFMEIPTTADDNPINNRDKQYLLNEHGELIGYLDRLLEPVDLKGQSMAGRSEFDFNSPQRIAWWRGREYKYGNNALYGGGSVVNWNLSGIDDGTMSSLTLPPGCSVELFDGLNQSGASTTFNGYSDRARYVNDLVDYGWNNRVRSFTVTCSSNALDFCGYLYEDPQYNNDNASIAIYNDDEFYLNNNAGEPGSLFNNQFSSVLTNAYSNCDGIMLYDNPSDGNNGYYWVNPDADIPFLSSVGMENNVSRVRELRQIQSSSVDVNTDKHVGVVLYESVEYDGAHQLVAAEGTLTKTFFLEDPIFAHLNAMVVSPGCRVTLYDEQENQYSVDNRSANTPFKLRNTAYYYFDNSSVKIFNSTKVELQCNNSEVRFAGLAYTMPNYQGKSFPLFENVEFSPQDIPGLSNLRIKSIELNNSSVVDFLVVDKGSDNFHWRSIPVTKDLADISTWGDTNADFVKFTPLDAIGAHNAQNLVELSELDWDGLVAALDNAGSAPQIQVTSEQKTQLCRVAVNKCRTAFSELEHQQDWNDFYAGLAENTDIVVTSTSLAAYAYKIYQAAGAKAAANYVEAWEVLEGEPGMTEETMFEAYTSGMHNMANGFTSLNGGTLDATEEELQSLANSADVGGEGLEMTLQSTATADIGNGSEEVWLMLSENGDWVLSGPLMETATIQAGSEVATAAATAGSEGILAVEAVEALSAEAVLGPLAGIAAVGVGIYIGVKIIHSKHKISLHEPCDDFNKACLSNNFNGRLQIVP